MMHFDSLLQIVLTLFCLFSVGFLCRRVGIVTDASAKTFSRLVLEIGQPALIISALINASYTKEHVTLGLCVLVLGFVLHALYTVFAMAASRPIRDTDDRKLTAFSLVFANAGFIGFPIMEAVFGADGRFMGAFYIVSFNVLMWTLGVSMVAKGRSDIRLTPQKAFLNFGTVPCAIGIGLFFANLPLPEFVYTTSDYLAGLCTPVSVILTGALMANKPLKELVTTPKLYYQSAMKLVAIPVIVALLAKLVTSLWSVPNPDTWILFSALVAGLPSAATVTMFSERYKLPHAEYASQAVGMSSILCLGTLPLVMLFAEFLTTI